MKVKVTASRLNVRSMPGSGGAKIGILTENTIVQVLGARNNWFEIRFNEAWGLLKIGLGGYVIGRSAEKIAPTLKGAMKKDEAKG